MARIAIRPGKRCLMARMRHTKTVLSRGLHRRIDLVAPAGYIARGRAMISASVRRSMSRQGGLYGKTEISKPLSHGEFSCAGPQRLIEFLALWS